MTRAQAITWIGSERFVFIDTEFIVPSRLNTLPHTLTRRGRSINASSFSDYGLDAGGREMSNGRKVGIPAFRDAKGGRDYFCPLSGDVPKSRRPVDFPAPRPAAAGIAASWPYFSRRTGTSAPSASFTNIILPSALRSIRTKSPSF